MYETAATNALQLKRLLTDRAQSSVPLRELRNELMNPGSNDFWSSVDKRFHDGLFAHRTLHKAALAESNDTLERAFFYLEFGRQLGHVPLLSTSKRRWLEIMGAHVQQSLHDIIKQKFQKTVLEQLEMDLGPAFEQIVTPTPPVAELVLRSAIERSHSLWQAALELRQSQEAADYRRLLTELRGLLHAGRPGAVEAQRCLSGLAKVAQIRGTHNDVALGVSRSKRKLKFDKIPLIGNLLAAAGMSEVEIRDRILTAPPGYLVFIARWYSPAPTNRASSERLP